MAVFDCPSAILEPPAAFAVVRSSNINILDDDLSFPQADNRFDVAINCQPIA